MASTTLEKSRAPDEAFLASLFDRLGASPADLLRAALHFAATHPGRAAPALLLEALELRGTQGAAEWLSKVGATVGTQEAMRLTGLSKSGLHKAKDDNRMLALRVPGAKAVDQFPLFQFEAGKVRGWIPALLAETGNGLPAAHFLAIDRKRLGNRAYLDLLRDHDDEQVIARMLSHAESIGDSARGEDPPAYAGS